MELTSNKSQRAEDERRDLGKTVVLFVLILVLVWTLTGCATVLEKSVAQCYALDGSPGYTRAEGVEKFSCERPVIPTRAMAR